MSTNESIALDLQRLNLNQPRPAMEQLSPPVSPDNYGFPPYGYQMQQVRPNNAPPFSELMVPPPQSYAQQAGSSFRSINSNCGPPHGAGAPFGQLPMGPQPVGALPPAPLYTQISCDMMSPREFNGVVQDYIQRLHVKKRDKALITKTRYNAIIAVHKNKKDTSIGSAQFRFWAKKMFEVDVVNGIVYNDEKPVAVLEELYEILTAAHGGSFHGGRDKTSAQLRDRYSWIPKELIARYVKHCPSCASRRRHGAAARVPSASPAAYGSPAGGSPAPSPDAPFADYDGPEDDYGPVDIAAAYGMPAPLDQRHVAATAMMQMNEQIPQHCGYILGSSGR